MGYDWEGGCKSKCGVSGKVHEMELVGHRVHVASGCAGLVHCGSIGWEET